MTTIDTRTNRARLLGLGAAIALLAGCGSSAGTPAASSAPAAPSAAGPSGGAAAAGTVTFNGVTVAGAQNLQAKPQVGSTSSAVAPALQVKDLVVGSGAAATPTSTVSVQYVGVLYATGKQFDASWDSGKPASFPLTGVVPGFTQGIGGTTGVPAMKIGGRRIMILPAALGYGPDGNPDAGIGAGASIVFVVDLLAVS